MSISKIIITGMLMLTSYTLSAQKDWNDLREKNVISSDTIKREGYTLIFLNESPGFDRH